jgi:hypothetical protein
MYITFSGCEFYQIKYCITKIPFRAAKVTPKLYNVTAVLDFRGRSLM